MEGRLRPIKMFLRVALTGLALGIAASAPAQQDSGKPFKPYPGLPGRDAVWVPSPDVTIERMLDFAKATPDDYVIDLGSGDGRMVIAAARRGIRGHGVEYNPDLVKLSNQLAKEAGVADKAHFVQGDMYVADISKASVIMVFLLTENLRKLTPNFLKLRPGTRIVANTFPVGDWQFDDSTRVEENCSGWCTVMLYIVPAQIGGVWRLGEQELVVKQEFQMFSGTLGGAPISKGRLRGTDLAFTVGDVEYTGRVEGNEMRGVTSGTGAAWSAKKQ